jgi:hypothetical protein
VFSDGSDLFRERQMISERLSELRDRMPEGVRPSWDRSPTLSARYINTRSSCRMKAMPIARSRAKN